MRVLLACSYSDWHQLIEHVLKDQGVELTECTPDRLMETAGRIRPHAIITDCSPWELKARLSVLEQVKRRDDTGRTLISIIDTGCCRESETAQELGLVIGCERLLAGLESLFLPRLRSMAAPN